MDRPFDERAAVEERLSAAELAVSVGIEPARVERLVQLGLVEPVEPGSHEFTARSATRLKRMFRLHRDLGLSLFGAAIVVDLVDRVDRLQAELARLGREV